MTRDRRRTGRASLRLPVPGAVRNREAHATVRAATVPVPPAATRAWSRPAAAGAAAAVEGGRDRLGRVADDPAGGADPRSPGRRRLGGWPGPTRTRIGAWRVADTSTTQAHASGRPATGAAVESQPSRTVFSLGAKLAVTVAVLLVVLAGYLFYSPIQYHGSTDIPVRCGSAASPVKSRFIQGYCGDLNSIRRDQAIGVLIAALVVAAGGIIAFGVSRRPVTTADEADATGADMSGWDDRAADGAANAARDSRAAGAGPEHPAWSGGAQDQVRDVEASHGWAPRDRYAGQEPAPPVSSAASPDKATVGDSAPDADVQADRTAGADRADKAGDVADASGITGTDRATTRLAVPAGSSNQPPPSPAAARPLDPSLDHPKASDEDQVIP